MTTCNTSINIDFLKNHPYHIDALLSLWQEVLGNIWMPSVSLDRMRNNILTHLNCDTLPIGYIALDGSKPVGMCSLRSHDSVRPDLIPCISNLCVMPSYQHRGIGKSLMYKALSTAKNMNFDMAYLLVFDKNVAAWYTRHRWQTIGYESFDGNPLDIMMITLSERK
jgi:ribosomal protein S18 acetylase RimI-like enzyme